MIAQESQRVVPDAPPSSIFADQECPFLAGIAGVGGEVVGVARPWRPCVPCLKPSPCAAGKHLRRAL